MQSSMRHRILAVLGAFLAGAVLGGIAVGFLVYLRTAYHSTVTSEKRLALNGMEILSRDGVEYVGWGFMEPNGSSLILTAEGGLPITLYKSQRIFQESYPLIDQVAVVDGRLVWNDGLYRYGLTIEPQAKTAAAATTTGPAR